MNKNTSRWIVASITEYFRKIASTYIDFVSEDEEHDVSNKNSWAELRIDGPRYKQVSVNSYVISVDIDILITNHLSKADMFEIHELAGLFEAACASIPIYKYGEEVATYLFCLTLDPGISQNIRKVYLGRPPNTRLKRVSVMAFYENTEQLE